MSYIKFNGTDNKYQAQIHPFTTLSGKGAVRVTSNAPININGFKFYLDDGTLLNNYSNYTYVYELNNNDVVYSESSEQPISPIMTYTQSKVTQIDRINKRLSNINNNLNVISNEVALKADDERVDGIDEVIENILEDIIPSIIEDTAYDDIDMEDIE